MTKFTSRDLMETLVAARRDRDLGTALACYEPTAMAVIEPSKSATGSEALTAFTSGMMDLPISFSGRTFVESGDLALHVSEWTITPRGGDAAPPMTGRTTDVLRRQGNGSWLVAIDNPWGVAVLDGIAPISPAPATTVGTSSAQNKALVLEAFDTLFNKRDYPAAEAFWSDRYIQHSAHIGPGRNSLFDLVRNAPATLRYEHGLILAEADFVIVHGRFSGNGRPAAWVAADILRIEDGLLAEHWDVLQDEATQSQSKSGLPMFGDRFIEALARP